MERRITLCFVSMQRPTATEKHFSIFHWSVFLSSTNFAPNSKAFVIAWPIRWSISLVQWSTSISHLRVYEDNTQRQSTDKICSDSLSMEDNSEKKEEQIFSRCEQQTLRQSHRSTCFLYTNCRFFLQDFPQKFPFLSCFQSRKKRLTRVDRSLLSPFPRRSFSLLKQSRRDQLHPSPFLCRNRFLQLLCIFEWSDCLFVELFFDGQCSFSLSSIAVLGHNSYSCNLFHLSKIFFNFFLIVSVSGVVLATNSFVGVSIGLNIGQLNTQHRLFSAIRRGPIIPTRNTFITNPIATALLLLLIKKQNWTVQPTRRKCRSDQFHRQISNRRRNKSTKKFSRSHWTCEEKKQSDFSRKRNFTLF